LLFGRAPRLRPMIAGVRFRPLEKETLMSWTTPRVIEIAVGMEINCYACADI
jgi:coenzyme PQQ precursor peptide PqqA